MIEYTITNEPNQSFIIPFEDTRIIIDIEYLVIPSCWQMSITFRDEELVNGLVLNSAVVALDTYNLPFDIYINDVNNIGLSPFNLFNFSDGLYTFNLVTRDELTSFRGFEVQ